MIWKKVIFVRYIILLHFGFQFWVFTHKRKTNLQICKICGKLFLSMHPPLSKFWRKKETLFEFNVFFFLRLMHSTCSWTNRANMKWSELVRQTTFKRMDISVVNKDTFYLFFRKTGGEFFIWPSFLSEFNKVTFLFV